MPNLIKCPDCEREVSQRAASCPSCGAPLGGGGSSVGGNSGNVAFENRIEEYKANGYVVRKREVNSVEMKLVGWHGNAKRFIPVFIITGIITALFGAGALLTFLFSNYLLGFILLIITGVAMFFINKIEVVARKVIISINSVGKLEETGSVLKQN